MDGNRRWAEGNKVAQVLGHKEGMLAIDRVIKGCLANNIRYVTFYAFSTENWTREKFELRYLTRLMYRYMMQILERGETSKLYRKVKVRFIGEKSDFGERNEKLMIDVENRDTPEVDCHVNIAVSYGGRDEIVHAVNLALADGKTSFTKDTIEHYLYTSGQPDPDLLVRTSDVQRISNFLTWQTVYSEILFLEKFWPDMQESDIADLLATYAERERRFGK